MSKQKSVSRNPSIKQAELKKQQPQSSGKDTSNRNKQWIVFAVLAILTFVVFYPSLKCEFTNWDDGTYVTENPMIWKLNGKAIKEILETNAYEKHLSAASLKI